MIINLTPHPITLAPPGRGRITIPASGTIARVISAPARRIAAADSEADGPCAVEHWTCPTGGEVQGLPSAPCSTCLGVEPDNGCPGNHEHDKLYIVSAMVLAHPSVRGRMDVCAPGTGPADGAVRDATGRIEAVTRLVFPVE